MIKNKMNIILTTLVLLIAINPALSAVQFDTNLIVCDVYEDNTVLEGFEYILVSDDTGKEYSFITENKGIHSVKVPSGYYTLKETETPPQFEKSKDLMLQLPIGDSVKLLDTLKIYPKHKLKKYSDPNSIPKDIELEVGIVSNKSPKGKSDENDISSSQDKPPSDLGERRDESATELDKGGVSKNPKTTTSNNLNYLKTGLDPDSYKDNSSEYLNLLTMIILLVVSKRKLRGDI